LLPAALAGKAVASATPAGKIEPGLTLLPSQTLQAGAGANAVATGDLTGNGHTDLIVADAYANAVNVLPGNGAGGFGHPTQYRVGAGPSAVIAVDLNGDGRLDIATANAGDNTVSVLLNNGHGGFLPAKSYPAGLFPIALAAANLDGSGRLDLVTANANGGNVTVLLNDGRGGFHLGASYTVDRTPRALVVADVNGDGQPDLLVASAGDPTGTTGTLSVLLGQPGGSFQPAINYAIPAQPEAMAAGDFTGTGAVDLAVSSLDGTVNILLGTGDGRFRMGQSLNAGAGASGVSIGDLNGDGIDDLAVANTAQGGISLFLGRGDGTFESGRTIATSRGAQALAVGDFGGDGALGIAVANFSANSVSIVRRDSSPPVTSLSFDDSIVASDSLDQPTIGPQTLITLAASDPDSAVSVLDYRVFPQGAALASRFIAQSSTGSTASVSFTLAGQPDGVYVIQYTARDPAGNVSPMKSMYVTLDNDPPTVTLDEPLGATVHEQGVLHLRAHGAGVALIAYRFYRLGNTLSPFTFSAGTQAEVTLSGPTGAYVVEYYAVDALGNGGPNTAGRALFSVDAAPSTEEALAALAHQGALGIALRVALEHGSALTSGPSAGDWTRPASVTATIAAAWPPDEATMTIIRALACWLALLLVVLLLVVLWLRIES
jgi:hypothetical protein